MVTSYRPRVRAIVAATCVLAIALLGGCAKTESPRGASVNLQVEDEMWAYQEQLTQECMRESGFDYIARVAPPVTEQRIVQSPYGLTLERARSNGFGYVQSVMSETGVMVKNDANSNYRESLVEADRIHFDHALEGNPASGSEGCRADARDRALKKFGDQFETIVGNSDSLKDIVADPRYVKFETAWAQCMTGAGYETTGFEDFHRGWVVKASAIAPAKDIDPNAKTLDAASSVRTIDPAVADAALNAEIAAAIANVECLKPLESEFNELVDDVLG